MKSVTYSAPGKIILSGEHAVVYGRPAIATAIDKRLTVTLRLSDTSRLSDKPDSWLVLENLVKRHLNLSQLPKIEVKIVSDILKKSGLGSSAAFASAGLACLLHLLTKKQPSLDLVNKLAFQAEKHFHKNPSGIDNSTVVYGGFVFYRKEFEFLKLVSNLSIKIPQSFQSRMFLIYTGKPKESTAEMVEFVGKLWNQQPQATEKIINEIEKVTKRIVISIVQENFKFFYDSVKANQRLLEELGVFSDYSKNLLSFLADYGVYKLVGAGGRHKGSGFVLFVAKYNNIESLLVKKNLKFFPYKFSVSGLRLENED
ncbi:MAG: mevalonate kinase [Patescibacteria group bacterium]|nr:MAG: mevalonate kinase [Patescibacteria group bacterium]